MNPVTVAILTLRALSTLFTTAGRATESKALGQIADGLEAGQSVDLHMKAVADALKAGDAADWAGVAQRIQEDTDRLNQS